MMVYSFWLGGFVVLMGLNLGIMVEARMTRPLFVIALIIGAVLWPIMLIALLWAVWNSNPK